MSSPASVSNSRSSQAPPDAQADTSWTAPRPRLLVLFTSPLSARLVRGQLRYMRQAGFDVTVASAPGPDLDALCAAEGLTPLRLPLRREIAPFADLSTLVRLVWHLERLRPDVVNASTPKAGLLGMIAAWLTGVPVRLYTLRGLRLETARGPMRAALAAAERLAGSCADAVVCVSPSLRRQALSFGLVPAHKARVLGAGSSNGVDAARFADTPERRAAAIALRKRLGLPAGAPVVGFVGRLTRDKGIVDLWHAFQRLREDHPQVRLLLVGAFEAGDSVPVECVMALRSDPAVVGAGWVPDAALHYALMDVLALPSYREGFPNVPLEAAAAGVPVVGYDATGTSDAIVDGSTGVLVPKGDTKGLARALASYLADPALRARHGEAGRRRAESVFQPERVWAALAQEYRVALESARPRGIRRLLRSAALKRLVDVAGATAGLAAGAGPLAVAAATVRARLGSPVLFRQRRPGLRGRPFTLVKLKTMSDRRSLAGALLPDAERLTALGRLLRSTSLDELPELWNVLRGDMSLVGPRPLLEEYLDRYSPEAARRHEVRPGLTGWAQVHGRNAVDWEERFRLDQWYVDRWDLLLDLRILAQTIGAVLRRDGIAQEGHATMDRFRGSRRPPEDSESTVEGLGRNPHGAG